MPGDGQILRWPENFRHYIGVVPVCAGIGDFLSPSSCSSNVIPNKISVTIDCANISYVISYSCLFSHQWKECPYPNINQHFFEVQSQNLCVFRVPMWTGSD